MSRAAGFTSATSATSCSSTCSWSRVRWTLWNSRPRCQSAVWMSLMAANPTQGRGRSGERAPRTADPRCALCARPRPRLCARQGRIGQVRTFRLSKSRITAGLQCGKRLWLVIHRPELEVYSADTQRRFAAGNSVGEVARKLYGAGELIDGGRNLSQALRDTEAALAAPGDVTLYEATFRHSGVP